MQGQHAIEIPKKYHRLIIVRACVGFGGINGFWGATKFLPTSIAVCLDSLFSVWMTLMARVVLKEKLSYLDIVALFFGFIGILLINDPFDWYVRPDQKTQNSEK